MGRPRQHDETTRRALMNAAERLVAEGGVDALGVRSAAEAAGTSTRAVYALFGSKDGLVQALGQRAYALVMERVAAVPLTDDAGEDLIAAGVDGFRAFVVDHPDLFRLFFISRPIGWQMSQDTDATRQAALHQLVLRVERAQAAGILGDLSVDRMTFLWDAMCCGLAIQECSLPAGRQDGERVWRDALNALLVGISVESRTRGQATA
jgi:AcrR family transcriptional regulator